MSDYQTRYQMRQKRRSNRFINVFIVLTLLCIIYFGGRIIFEQEDVASVEDAAKTEETESNPAEVEEREPSQQTSKVNKEETENKEEQEKTEKLEQENPASNGNWKPIGTTQTEPFEADFTKDSTNWKEMSEALQYATGLGEDMIIWYIENGGNLQSAIGTVSDFDTKDTPYQVRIEWIANEGWLPVEVNQLEENPYN